jgi:hypothetical protein
MDSISTHREALKWAFELLEGVMEDVTQEQVDWIPPGIANPLGAIYAHALGELDTAVNMLVKGGQPLYATSWAGKIGFDEPRWDMDLEWARRVKVDLPVARRYARALYESVDAYIASLSEESLDRQVDLTEQGLGVRTVSWCLNALVTSHINNMAGEISTLKGIQGAKGYPF